MKIMRGDLVYGETRPTIVSWSKLDIFAGTLQTPWKNALRAPSTMQMQVPRKAPRLQVAGMHGRGNLEVCISKEPCSAVI